VLKLNEVDAEIVADGFEGGEIVPQLRQFDCVGQKLLLRRMLEFLLKPFILMTSVVFPI
jgi:hypothetical protein